MSVSGQGVHLVNVFQWLRGESNTPKPGTKRGSPEDRPGCAGLGAILRDLSQIRHGGTLVNSAEATTGRRSYRPRGFGKRERWPCR